MAQNTGLSREFAPNPDTGGGEETISCFKCNIMTSNYQVTPIFHPDIIIILIRSVLEDRVSPFLDPRPVGYWLSGMEPLLSFLTLSLLSPNFPLDFHPALMQIGLFCRSFSL